MASRVTLINNNSSQVVLASASRTTTQTSPDIGTAGGGRLHVILDITDVSASPSITLTIKGKDPASGKYYTLLAGAAVTTAVTTVYRVGPGLTASANAVANDMVPAVIQILVTAGNANACIYSVGLNAGI